MQKVLFAISLSIVLSQISNAQAVNVSSWNDFVTDVKDNSITQITVDGDFTADTELDTSKNSGTINRSLTISGSATNVPTINGNEKNMYLRAGDGNTITLENISFTKFKHYPSTEKNSVFAAHRDGKFVLNNVTLSEISNKDNMPMWGAVFSVSDHSSASISNSKFVGNAQRTTSSDKDGATSGVLNVQGKITSFEQSQLNELSNSSFENNSITATNTNAYGGAIFMEGLADKMTDNQFIGNMAKTETNNHNAYGGALAVGGVYTTRDTATINEISGGKFVDNSAQAETGQSFGGAIYVSSTGLIKNISGVEFTNNTAQFGGAIYNAGIIENLESSNFTTNNDSIVNAANATIGKISGLTSKSTLTNAGTINEIDGTNTLKDLVNIGTGAMTISSTGAVTLSDGFTNESNIYNNGSLFITNGTAYNSGNITGTMTFSQADSTVDTTLENTGTIDNIESSVFSGGRTAALSNSGTINSLSNVEIKGLFENVSGNVSVKNNLTADRTINNSVMNFDGVTYSGNIYNYSRLNTSDTNTISGGTMYNNGQLNIDSGSLIINDGLNNKSVILNNGTLVVSGNSSNSGYIAGDITIGNGTASTFTKTTGHILGKTNIVSQATVKSSLDALNDVDIASGGVLEVTDDSILKHNITGDGELLIANKLYFGQGSLSQTGTFSITNSGMIDVEDRNLNVGTFNLNGQMNIDISSISANISDYTGGKIIVTNDATIGNDAVLNVTIASEMLQKGEKTGELKIVDGNNVTGKFNNIASNNRYTITAGNTDGTIVVTGIASAEDVAGTIGNRNNQNTAAAWDSANVTAGSPAAEIKSILNEASQHDTARYVRDLTLIAPTDSKLALMTTRELNNQISRSTWNRVNRNDKMCNSAFSQSSMWMEGLGNYSHQDDHFEAAGFSARTAGYMLGIDSNIDCATMAGVGYAFNYTDASSDSRDTDIKGHTIFTYGKYQPRFGYVRGMLSYGYANYHEKSAVENIALSSKYNVQALSGEMATGYEFKDGFIPETGLRYTYLMPEGYTDSLGQKVNPDNSHLLTATAMLHFRPRCGDVWYNVRPTAYVGLTYDLYSPDTKTNVRIADNRYQISSKRMPRLGAEGGIGLEMSVNNWDISVGYDLGIREDYQSHTGMLKARYNF